MRARKTMCDNESRRSSVNKTIYTTRSRVRVDKSNEKSKYYQQTDRPTGFVHVHVHVHATKKPIYISLSIRILFNKSG